MKLNGTMRVNEKGHLEIGGCDSLDLAREFGTPLYVLDEMCFRESCRDYYHSFTQSYGAEVIYAGKTLLNLAVCRMVEEEGLGLDVVSGGELFTALKAGFPAERIYFHGNNKSYAELAMALEAEVGFFMVDNLCELELLNSLAEKAGKKATVILRVTPGIEAHTHSYIRTGQIDSKFGLVIENGQAMAAVKRALELKKIDFKGLHCHIGSQIFELESYSHTVEVMMAFANKVFEETGCHVKVLDLGGGLGVYYVEGDQPRPVKDYAAVTMKAVLEKAAEYNFPAPKIIVEPGRSISGPAGTTLYTVGAIKDIPGIRKYLAVDGGMGDNPRLALYQARYEACLAGKVKQQPSELVSVAGKCCESGDMLIWDIELPSAETGDILAVSCTGAYNYSMAMNYNRLPRPAMVLVRGGGAELITRRESYEDLVSHDLIPERLR
ncbi:diaminopimelate decarboxylase [Pelotomaculum isophthalicicum JI]|uniref:Diaminopimelate decarboxylase n=1 Tax=Pelotomaculum isophthalicicum JI TaxID=947010 RepID=A0A9X4H6L2_9FIRM|nr:diaminopimelate decarboxylase [Pelotomaculum isophthalicicum]MDF9408978.1 diaminopimelate decarboxylase [Pelotomaculum isophthalicicum JI]